MQNSTQAANAWRILFLLFLANLFNFFRPHDPGHHH